jgi:SOS-response transcriptional repressor LexA
MTPLTTKQRELYHFLTEHFAAHEVAPTYTEIAQQLGICYSSARHLVKQLEKRGRIRILPNSHRAIEILPNGHA